MRKLDLKKDLKYLYAPSARRAAIVEVPSLQFAMVDGAIEKGYEPGNSPGYAEATQALYSVAYTLKFMLKKRESDPVEYPVMPLEGLWGVEDGRFDLQVKDNWNYTSLILQPDVVTAEIFEDAREQVRRKKGESAALSRMRLAHFEEGTCVQIMHIGPYAAEPASIERMLAFARERGYRDRVGPNGRHHEIYLSDPRKAAPEKMRTVLRHPIEQI